MKSRSWAILTNFETLAVFNADWKDSNYGNNLFFALHPNDFLTDDRFLKLSKKAFENNEIDKLASKYGKKQLKNPIDKQLLQDMIHFRDILSKDIIKNNQNKNLSQEDIDESVQRILDRLIFIRNAEDRELEENKLESDVRQWSEKGKGQLIKEISKVYSYYDDHYNSKLFSKHLCDDLYIDNDVLKEVIEGLNHSKDNSYRYDSSLIESDVLGNIYELYIGNIRKSTPKQAKLGGLNVHRKEQGIYYAPSYIVDYIVKNTVGEYIKTHTPEEIKNVKILDPACGSGSFLIKAYKELENYWNDYYSKNKTLPKSARNIVQTKFDPNNQENIEFYSTKTEILKNNIFGVDFDPKAVEIAQLNLLLQISEKKQKLPVLKNNIKIGNSLIDDTSISDKAFKWEDRFPEIMENRGFDIVIGNPPYINIYLLAKDPKSVEYYQKTYFSAHKKFDLYVLFIERAIKLLNENGYLSFIVPDKFLSQPYGENLRKFILENCCIVKIVDLTKYKIFKEATVDNIILILKKNVNEDDRNKNKIKIVRPLEDPNVKNNIREEIVEIEQKSYSENELNLFRLDINPAKLRLKGKIENESVFIKDICYVNWGTRSSDKKLSIVKEKVNDLCKPMLQGRDMDRYAIIYGNKYLIYDIDKLYNPMFKELFENPKIIIREVSGKEGIKATFDDKSYYMEHSLSICMPYYELEGVDRRGLKLTTEQINNSKLYDIKYILAVLNLKLIAFYFKTFIGSGLNVYPGSIRSLPIKRVDKTEQDKIVILVDKMLLLNKRIVAEGGKHTDEINKYKDEIKETDAKIDESIYKIYGITEEEKKLIKESLL